METTLGWHFVGATLRLLEKQIGALYRLAPAARQIDRELIRGIIELLESLMEVDNERKGD